MSTHRLQLPELDKKTRSSKKIWVVLGVTAVFCLLLLYAVYSLKGFHDCQVLDPSIVVTAGAPGLLDLRVEAGQQVAAGDYLGSVEGEEKKKALSDLENSILALEIALPLDYTGYTNTEGKRTPGRFSDEALQGAVDVETAAREALNAASVNESVMAVEMRKLMQRSSRGEVNQRKVVEADNSYNTARAATGRLRKAFETASAQRAAIEKERSRIRALQLESGLEETPASVRVQQYEAFRAQHEVLRKNYESSVFFARFPSVVTAVHAADKDVVGVGQPVVTLRPLYGYTLSVTALVSGAYSRQLQVGDRCLVRIAPYGQEPLPGTISSMVPQEGGWRRFLPADLQLVRVYIEVPVMAGDKTIGDKTIAVDGPVEITHSPETNRKDLPPR